MFSVVVPVYNHQSYVASALISAAQSPLVTEVLVVDDGSADNSARIVRELADTHSKITVQPAAQAGNRGADIRLNELVKDAQNEWIAVLNSDDEFVAGRFELIEREARQETVDLFFGDLVIVDDTGTRIGLRRAITDNEYLWPEEFDPIEAADSGRWTELLLQQNIIATTTNMIFTRSIFERVGGFRSYRYCHDWDFALRVALLGRMKYAPLLLSRYRIHQGNTIREKRIGVETEVREMMAQLRASFPRLASDSTLQSAILGNRYLYPHRARWLQIVRDSNAAFNLAEATLPLADLDVDFVESPQRSGDEGTYIHAPGPGVGELTANDLRNLRLAAAVRSYDVFLVSRALQPSPSAGTASLQDFIFYNRRWIKDAGRRANARLVRLLPATRKPQLLHDLIDIANFSIDDAFAEICSDAAWPPPLPLPPNGLGTRPVKPTVFIFPIFLAMGGAERLVLETMKHLVWKYKFVIINTEPLLAEYGSVHEEALRYADVYDIAETVRVDDRLTAIELLRRQYSPAAVWITNGSPWQIAHARQLRAIFAATPIVDNQVYDHENGWIRAFSDPDIRSADRFIAINERIRTVMLERFNIAEDRIDLVYHGANIAHLRKEQIGSRDTAAARTALGLPSAGLLFGMIGRLTSQKRPQDLVRLAARIQARGDNAHHFLWAGPGEMRDEIEKLRVELDVRNFSLLAPMQDVLPLYRAMDGLIVTSEFEGLPFVVLEALAMAVPVLSTPVGAIEEVLTAFGSGRIGGAPGDLDALEAAFLEFVEELPALRTVAAARRVAFIDQFSSERMASEYDASWSRAIGAFAQPRRELG